MLIWGAEGKSRVIGDAGMKHCNVCGESRPFIYAVNYKMRHIWYVIRWSTGRSYTQFCSICQNGLPVEKAEIDARNIGGEASRSEVPFFDRMGWAIALAAIAVLIVFAVIAGNADKQEEATLIAAPQVGDLYAVNVEKFLPDGAVAANSIGGDYGVFRVAAVKDGELLLDAPKIVYSRMKGVRRDLSSGKVKDKSYYEGQMAIPLSAIKKFHADGVINDVERN